MEIDNSVEIEESDKRCSDVHNKELISVKSGKINKYLGDIDQEQDYVSDLNADVDLDESVEHSVGEEQNNMNGHSKDESQSNEHVGLQENEPRSEHNDVSNTFEATENVKDESDFTIIDTDTNQCGNFNGLFESHENISKIDDKINDILEGTDISELNNSEITDSEMGNNLDGNEGSAAESESVKIETESENELNEKGKDEITEKCDIATKIPTDSEQMNGNECEDGLETTDVKGPTESDIHEEEIGTDVDRISLSEENTDEALHEKEHKSSDKTDTKLDNNVSESDSETKSVNGKSNIVDIVQDEVENGKVDEIQPGEGQGSEHREKPVCLEPVDIGQNNDQIDSINDSDNIDKEGIQQFLKAVIEDLQGIVIEAEECDNIVEDISSKDDKDNNDNLEIEPGVPLTDKDEPKIDIEENPASVDKGLEVDREDSLDETRVEKLEIIIDHNDSDDLEINSDEKSCELMIEERSDEAVPCSSCSADENDIKLVPESESSGNVNVESTNDEANIAGQQFSDDQASASTNDETINANENSNEQANGSTNVEHTCTKDYINESVSGENINANENMSGEQIDRSVNSETIDEVEQIDKELTKAPEAISVGQSSATDTNDVTKTKDECIEQSCAMKLESTESARNETEKCEAATNAIKEATEVNMVSTDQTLMELKSSLRVSQQLLVDERAKHNREVMSLKLQLCRSQMQLKCQRSRSEKQMADIMAQLVVLESRLLKEQKTLKMELKTRNQTIIEQKQEIIKLRDQNEQLLNAIKEICANGGMNGYMRENRRKSGSNSDFDHGGKMAKDKKGHNSGKLGSVKDKFLSKNRSSLELNSFNLEKYLIKDSRLCSSQEDLHRITSEDRRQSIPNSDSSNFNGMERFEMTPKDRPHSDSSEYKNKNRKQVRYSQNIFHETGSPRLDIMKSISDSSQLSENSVTSSGVYSLSDHDLSSTHDISLTNGNHSNQNNDYYEEEEDDRIFSFSSTHINTVIDEEDIMGPVSHSGPMMSMGSMPMLANLSEGQSMKSGKNRPHSLSSVDLASIQQQAENMSSSPGGKHPHSPLASERGTPPNSPSYVQNKNEMTPFQTFKTMFRRKGSSKSKGQKKRSVSLSQTTNKEYSEALKKHFQKYDMS